MWSWSWKGGRPARTSSPRSIPRPPGRPIVRASCAAMRSAGSGRSRKRTGIAAWVTKCSARRGLLSCCTRRICVAMSARRSAPSPRANRRRSPRKRTICCNTMPRCASTFFRSDSRSWRRTGSTYTAAAFWSCNRRRILIPCPSHRVAGLISDPISSEPGCNARRRWCGKRTSERQSPKAPAATLIGTRSTPMRQSNRRASRRGCSWSRTRERESSANHGDRHWSRRPRAGRHRNHVPPDASLSAIASRGTRGDAADHGRAARPPAAPPPPIPVPTETVAPARANVMFRPNVLPADVNARRIITALEAAPDVDTQRALIDQLRTITPDLLALRDIGAIAEVVAGLDRCLGKIQDPSVQEAIGGAAGALADEAIVERMVARLGEPRVPPAERAHLVRAVGALGAVSAGLVVDAYLHAPAELREPYRAAMREAGERATEILQTGVTSKVPEVVAASAEFLGLTGGQQTAPLLIDLARHSDERVREAALLGLAEIGGRDVSRPAIPFLKDESVLVRTAAARAIAAAGDAGATTVLVRRLEQEKDEGVLAALLKAIGQLGAMEALEVLAKYAEPGGKPRRTPFVRAAAIEGLARLDRMEAKALLELYARDKEPTVKRAAEASLK